MWIEKHETKNVFVNRKNTQIKEVVETFEVGLVMFRVVLWNN